MLADIILICQHRMFDYSLCIQQFGTTKYNLLHEKSTIKNHRYFIVGRE